MPVRGVLAGGELAIGHPLHELLERDFVVMVEAEVVQVGDLGATPGPRPFEPRYRRVMAAQHFEAGEAQQRVALLGAVGFEVGAAFCARTLAEGFISEMQAGELGGSDARVSDQRRLAQGGDFTGKPGCRQAGKFRNRLHVDIERVEEDAAIGRVGARALRVFGKQRMQRVEPDAGGAMRGGARDEMAEIGEIADPPVAARAQGVELRRQQPQPTAVALPAAHRGLRDRIERSRTRETGRHGGD